MKKMAYLGFVFILLLVGCVPFESGVLGEQKVKVYYLSVDKNGERSISYAEEAYTGTEPVRFALEQLLTDHVSGGLYTALPPGVQILSLEIQGTLAEINLSAPYDLLSGYDLTLANACIVLTITQFVNILEVNILSEGNIHPNGEKTTFLAEEFITETLTIIPIEYEVTLYFAQKDMRYLGEEKRNVVLRENESVESYVVNELIAGPKTQELEGALPAGTRLLSCHIDNKHCYVNLSKEFMEPKSASYARMSLLSIINSLNTLADIRSIEILVEGVQLETYHGFVLGSRLNGDYTTVNNGSIIDVNLYYFDETERYLLEIPTPFEYNYSKSLEQAVVERLASGKLPFGVLPVFPQNTRVLDVYSTESEVIVTIEYGEERPANEYLAHMAVVNTLVGIAPGKGIKIVEPHDIVSDIMSYGADASVVLN